MHAMGFAWRESSTGFGFWKTDSSPERGGGSPLGLTEGSLVTRITAFPTRDPSTTLRWSPSPFRGGF